MLFDIGRVLLARQVEFEQFLKTNYTYFGYLGWDIYFLG